MSERNGMIPVREHGEKKNIGYEEGEWFLGGKIKVPFFSKKFNEEKTCEKNVKIVYESAKNKKENYYIIKVFSFCGFF